MNLKKCKLDMTEQEINSMMDTLDEVIEELENDIAILKQRQKFLKSYIEKGETPTAIDNMAAMIESRLRLLSDSSRKGFDKVSVAFKAIMKSRSGG